MVCDIARNLSADDLTSIRALEGNLGLTLVAYACRSLAEDREQRLRTAMAEMGLPRPVEPAAANEEQLALIRETEHDLGVSLVAVLA